MTGRRVAVVGAGWAGLAAAVALTEAGSTVSLIEMAAHPGGRARRVGHDAHEFDNGQHILIGAYRDTLALMRRVGADPDHLLARSPLTLRYPDGQGLRLPGGPALPAFVRGVLAARGWPWHARLALLLAALGWLARGFRCDPRWTVARLCARLPAPVRVDLIEPLCVAALNTPASDASATVFLRVLRDALFSGPGAADLLLPRRSLDQLLPAPACRWLAGAGAQLHFGRRVVALQPVNGGWRIDSETFDAVVLACSASEAARLAEPHDAAWAAKAAALRYEPIVTVYLHAPGTRLPTPMVALRSGAQAPAQFVFDLGALGAAPGRLACAVSGAADWVAAGREATGDAVRRQLLAAFPEGSFPQPPEVVGVLSEKRATFRCVPALERPDSSIAPGLWAAGDYVAGPYPATLEGAVRSGQAAARALLDR